MIDLRSPFLCLVMSFGLAACGGGSGPVQLIAEVDPPNEVEAVDPPDNAAPVETELPDDPFDAFGTDEPDEVETETSELEQTLSESEDASIALTGLAIVADPDTNERVIVLRDGIFIAEDGTRTLNGLPLTLTADIPGAFAVSSSYVQADGPGIVGVSAAIDAIPEDGTAIFAGTATGFVITGGTGVDLTNGQSEVTLDYETGSVSVELNDFQSTSQISGNLIEAPLDSIEWTGAVIGGTGFSGGVLTIDGGSDIGDIVGNDARLVAQGQLFGQNDEGTAPVEVGGLTFIEGDDGIIFGAFIAD